MMEINCFGQTKKLIFCVDCEAKANGAQAGSFSI